MRWCEDNGEEEGDLFHGPNHNWRIEQKMCENALSNIAEFILFLNGLGCMYHYKTRVIYVNEENTLRVETVV